jgi:AcrR family transcriptional regulator
MGAAASTTRVRPDVSAEIVAEAVGYIREHGLANFRLRSFAEHIGTSHRMVIHYFGSKNRLLAAVFAAMRQLDIEDLRARGASAREAALHMWSTLAAPRGRLRASMFFDVYAAAIQDPEQFEDFLGSLEEWVSLLAGLLRAEGCAAGAADTRARAVTAGMRGLMMDLLARGDRAACDDAMQGIVDALLPG